MNGFVNCTKEAIGINKKFESYLKERIVVEQYNSSTPKIEAELLGCNEQASSLQQELQEAKRAERECIARAQRWEDPRSASDMCIEYNEEHKSKSLEYDRVAETCKSMEESMLSMKDLVNKIKEDVLSISHDVMNLKCNFIEKGNCEGDFIEAQLLLLDANISIPVCNSTDVENSIIEIPHQSINEQQDSSSSSASALVIGVLPVLAVGYHLLSL